MKATSILILFLLFGAKSFAQTSVATPEQLKKFYASTTCVVLDGNMMSEYNGYIEDAVKQSWKLTKYELISTDEYENRRKNPAYSFLMRSYGRYDKDKSKARYVFLSLVLGDPGAAASVDNMPDLCSFPLCYINADGSEPFLEKLPAILQFIQNHVELTKSNPDLNSKNILQHYNKASESVSDMKLYLVKEDLALEINTLAKLKKIYPNEIKLVTEEEIETAIKNKEKDVVFLHKVGPGKGMHKEARCWKAILGAADAKLYYFDYHTVDDKEPDGLLAKDLKKLKRQK